MDKINMYQLNLEDIGFYTLSDYRVKQSSLNSPMWRCELFITDRCNFNCPYCRPVKDRYKGDISLRQAKHVIDLWSFNHLKNIRFSGGEPTLHPDLVAMVEYCDGLDNIAVSTNGSRDLDYYLNLVDLGVTDFSISFDTCCSLDSEVIAWEKIYNTKVMKNIEELAKEVYITLGIVVTESTIDKLVETVIFGSELGVADIRVISSAQDNMLIKEVSEIPQRILDKHPILKYRVNHFIRGRNVRGLRLEDSSRCGIVMDDSHVADNHHFPCVIYFREGGDPIGKVGVNMRNERYERYKQHNSFEDPICLKNCLDVCIDYNNKYAMYHGD